MWRWLGVGAVLVVVGGLAVRLVVGAAGTETGWETVGSQWRRATVGWVVGEETPLTRRAPAEQADFWLREADRIVGSPERSAQLCIGAAWILDRPAEDFLGRYLLPPREPWLPVLFPKFDDQAVAQARQAFESKCAPRCLELAKAATRLEPDNPDWWRTRALLLFEPGELSKGARTPRDLDRWLDVLQECAEHDSDNALYDYLAALRFWASAAEYGGMDETFRVHIHDTDRFAQGEEYFRRGQSKSTLAFGLNVHRPVVDVLERSRLPRLQQPAVVRSQLFPIRAQGVVVALDRWLIARQYRCQAEERTADALGVLGERGKVFGQFGRAGRLQSLHLRMWANGLWRSYLWGTRRFAAEHENVLTQAQLAELQTNERRVLTGEAVLQEVALRLERNTATPKGSFAEALPAVVAGTALWTAVVTMLAALIAWGMLRVLVRRDDAATKVHPLGLALAWPAAYAASWLVLGALPAGMGGRLGQLVIYAIACVPLVALGTWLVWKLSQSVLPETPPRAVVTVAAALILSLCCLVYAEQFARSFERTQWLAARGSKAWSAYAVREAMHLDHAPWQWSVFQWLAYSGPIVAPLVALVFVVLWHTWRHSRRRGEAFLRFWWPVRREHWGGLAHSVRTSAVIAALFFLLVYLAVTPAQIGQAEATYQDAMRYVRDPDKHWARVSAAIAEVEADKELMRSIREDVETIMEQEAQR
jgi:hypothetical protein